MHQIDYDKLPNWNPDIVTFDTLDVKMKLEKPVVFKNCCHIRQSITLADALSNGRQIICYCGQTSNSLSDLCKDIRWQVQQEFHPSVEQVQIVQGILTHKYNRKKIYTDLIQSTNQQMPEFLQNMKKRFHKSNSISTIISYQQPKQDRVTFWAYCLLDKVKITIPVRFLQCKHSECYELTSLLRYQDQQQKLVMQKISLFECCHPNCAMSIQISSVQELITELVLDVELLTIINKSLPCSLKYIYLPKKQQFDLATENAETKLINKIYEIQFKSTEKNQMSLNEFIRSIQTLTVSIIQQEINPAQEKSLKQEKFKEKIINMVDPITHELVEFPVRCTQCIQHDICVDIRSFAATHILAKLRKQINNVCPLCKNEYNCLKGTLNQNIIYLDKNIIEKISCNMQYKNVEEEVYKMKRINYQGSKYLLDYIKKGQIYKKQQFFNDLIEANPEINIYDQFNQKIKIPILLLKCEKRSVIDFRSFYHCLMQINFNIEEANFNFCLCQSCSNSKPLESYRNVVFHEVYDEALQEFKTVKSFRFNLKTRQLSITEQLNV